MQYDSGIKKLISCKYTNACEFPTIHLLYEYLIGHLISFLCCNKMAFKIDNKF